MRTHVEKCPGGFAVVVPEPLSTQAGLHDGGQVDVELAGGRTVWPSRL
jgi:antitoxin component of MazEF toxin-antitoxin module